MAKREVFERQRHGMVYSDPDGEPYAFITPDFSEESYHTSKEKMLANGAEMHWEQVSPSEKQEKLMDEFDDLSLGEKRQGLDKLVNKLKELGKEE